MPKYKRSFERRVRRVLRDEAETKRVVQTKRQCHGFNPPRSVYPLYGISEGTGAETTEVWNVTHNHLRCWPVPLLYSETGLQSGHLSAPEIDRTQMARVRVGSEIWCKGISFKMSVCLKKQVPYAKIAIYLVKSKKGDTPHQALNTATWGEGGNFFMGYSQNKLMDMMDTRRHRIVKKWTRTLRQFDDSTSGGMIQSDGFVGFNKSTSKLDQYVVLKDPLGKSALEWATYIATDYPDYQIVTRDHCTMTDAFDHAMLAAGFDASLSTLTAKYTELDLAEQPPGTEQEFAIVDDANHTSTSVPIRDLINNGPFANSLSTGFYLTSNTTHGAKLAKQVALVEKVGILTGPSQDNIRFKHHQVIDLWIPGHLFGHGGRIKYDDANKTDELAGLYEYNLCFLSYGNYQTWTYTSAGGPGDARIMEVNDFQQVMYFKDP